MAGLDTRTWVNNTPMIRILEDCGFENIGKTMDWDERESVNYRWNALD
jgi:RimJ/RimL family protein N-acetyltransferase